MDLARIDEEISQQRLILCNLCSRRNSLAYISRLPAELLEYIFIQIARDHFWSDASSSFHVSYWARVSHVSSHWRNVALNCPILWSYVLSTSQHWIDVLLERSGQTPLKICIDVENRADSSRLSKFIEKILEHAERIEELRFYTRCWNKLTSRCFAALYSSASHLQTLDFSMKPIPPTPDFGGNIPPPCNFFTLSTVTTLNIRFTHPSLQEDVPGFQAALCCMPNLVHLYLHDALASASDFISSPEFDALQRIDLPCLSRLLVVAPLSTIIAFLSSVNIPVHTQIRLEFGPEEHPTCDNYDRFCSVLAQHYSNDRASSLPMVRSVVMNFDPRLYEGRLFIFSTSLEYDRPSLVHSLSLYNWVSDVLLKIIVGPVLYSEPEISRLGRDICASMPMTNVQTLYIDDPPPCQTFWRETLGHFPGLRRMELCAGFMPNDLISTFLPNTADEFVENESGVQASALEELMLNDMEFQRLGDQLDGHEASNMGETDLNLPPFEGLQSLCSALSSHAGSRGRLMMTNCYVDDNYDFSYDMVGQWEGSHFYIVSISQDQAYQSSSWL